MVRKRHIPEQIITALREAEVGLARGKSVKLISRELGITEQTYYRWRREYGGMKVSQARRLKEIERENGRLKLLTVLDEHTRECLAIVVARKIRSHDVLEVLADLFVRHGPPEYLRSDNGPESSPRSSCCGGWGAWASRRSLSNRAARGRTATTRASTASSGTSC